MSQLKKAIANLINEKCLFNISRAFSNFHKENNSIRNAPTLKFN